VHQNFSSHYRATIGVDFALKVLHWDPETVVRLQLWDIAGERGRRGAAQCPVPGYHLPPSVRSRSPKTLFEVVRNFVFKGKKKKSSLLGLKLEVELWAVAITPSLAFSPPRAGGRGVPEGD
jgi:hypothetical protein